MPVAPWRMGNRKMAKADVEPVTLFKRLLEIRGLLFHVLASFVLAAPLFAGEYIYLAPQKYVYPYPMDGSIGVLGYLRGGEPGTPVTIKIALELPDGNVTWLNPALEFHPEEKAVLEDFPFVHVPVANLFEISQDMVYTGTQGEGTGLEEFMPGKYVLRAELTGEGLTDSSGEEFWIVPQEFVPQIGDIPRPVILGLEPPYGDTGDLITIRGRGLRGHESLVDPGLIGPDNIQVFVGDVPQSIESMDESGTLISFRVGEGTKSGMVTVHLTIPYWLETNETGDQSAIPQVLELESTPWPFYMRPVIEGVEPYEFHQGESITITGENFSAAPRANAVFINGIPAPVEDGDNTTLKVTVPEGTGTDSPPVRIEVVANGLRSLPFVLEFEPPVIEEVLPAVIRSGDTVTIGGMNFSAAQGGNEVYFNGVRGQILEATNTTITAVAPGGMGSGSHWVTIEVKAHGMKSAPYSSGLTVPVVYYAYPGRVLPGGSITIVGTGFGEDVEKVRVFLDAFPLTITSVSESVLTATVPQRLSHGRYKLVVRVWDEDVRAIKDVYVEVLPEW